MSNSITTISDRVETITKTYSYHGFNVFVQSLNMFESVTLRVSISYLINGQVEPNEPHDDNYNYVNKYVTLTGTDYTNWGNDDSYLVNWVNTHIEDVLNSTLQVNIFPIFPQPF